MSLKTKSAKNRHASRYTCRNSHPHPTTSSPPKLPRKVAGRHIQSLASLFRAMKKDLALVRKSFACFFKSICIFLKKHANKKTNGCNCFSSQVGHRIRSMLYILLLRHKKADAQKARHYFTVPVGIFKRCKRRFRWKVSPHVYDKNPRGS